MPNSGCRGEGRRVCWGERGDPGATLSHTQVNRDVPTFWTNTPEQTHLNGCPWSFPHSFNGYGEHPGPKGCPPKFMFFLEPQNVTLFGNRIFTDTLVNMRSHWTRGALTQYAWCPHKKTARDTHREGGQPHGDRGGDGSHVSASQATPRMAGHPQQLGARPGPDSPPGPPEGANAAYTLHVAF